MAKPAPFSQRGMHVNAKRWSVVVGLGVLVGGMGAAAPASAAQTTQVIQCGGHPLTLRTNSNNSSDNGGWSAAQVVGDGTLIPTSFSFQVVDNVTHESVGPFTQVKGGGNANHNQQAITCTQSMTDTLANLLGPGDTPPPGWARTDSATFTLTVTAVPRP